MANYTKTTNFTSKDSLSTGNPLKIIRGSEHDTEYSNIATAIQTKADTASPALTGTTTAVNITVSGALVVGSDTVTTNTATQTLTNKTLALGSNTVSGTTAQFNTALTDGDFATLAGTETLTNKTISGGSITGITDLAVADGGTGASSITSNSVILGNGSSALSGNLVAPSTSGNVLTSNGTTWTSVAGAYPLTSGTAVASTSGTSIDFTSIPSWVKRITVMFNAVSLSGNSTIRIQLGTGSTTYTTTGYVTFGVTFSTGGLGGGTDTGGFVIGQNHTAGGVTTYGGSCIITNITGNTWSYMAVMGGSSTTNGGQLGGGSVPLGATLTAVRITTVNGTDTFDAGSVNILYE